MIEDTMLSRAKLLQFAICLLSTPHLFAAAEMFPIAKGVYRYQDTCNIYAIVRNQKALLVALGCSQVQGCLFYGPMSRDEVLGLASGAGKLKQAS